jgi:hypothetical protein
VFSGRGAGFVPAFKNEYILEIFSCQDFLRRTEGDSAFFWWGALEIRAFLGGASIFCGEGPPFGLAMKNNLCFF